MIQPNPVDVDDQPHVFVTDFIDPLFAGAITVGVAEFIKEKWFQAWIVPTGQEWFHIFTLCLGLLTVILSWSGYHKSIKRHPLQGRIRFLIDVVIVILYAVLLAKFASVDASFCLLMIIYWFYVLWDTWKIKEYSEEYRDASGKVKPKHRERVSITYAFVFTALYAVYHTFYSLNTTGTLVMSRSVSEAFKGAALFLAYILTVCYRYSKGVSFIKGITATIEKFGTTH